MAGGPGAAGVPASSARSAPSARARRGPGAARRRPARGGGGRRRAARCCLPRSPGLSGSRLRPPGQPLLRGPGAAARPRSPSAAALRFWPCSAPEKGRLVAGRAAGRGSQPPACSLQPAASSHAARRTSARRTPAARQTCRLDPAFGEGWEPAGLGGPGGGRREAQGGKARPRSLPRTPGGATLQPAGFCNEARAGQEAGGSQSDFSSTLLSKRGRKKAKERSVGDKR